MDERKRTPILVVLLAGVGVLAIGVALLLGAVFYGISSGRLASIEALPQGMIPSRQLTEISKIVQLRPNEQVLYFYSAAVTVAGDGNLFTNERVVSYTTDEGPLEVFEAEYDQVESATLHRSGSWLDDSTLDVLLKDGRTITLWVSPEQGLDVDFHEKLLAQLERHREAKRAGSSPEAEGPDKAVVPLP
jgi:hypothetical protein